MTTNTIGRIRASERYIDAVTIIDEKGFAVFDVPRIAILEGYEEKLGISHWALDPRASREFSEEEQAAIAHRLVACWNACDGISTANLQQNLPVKMLAESYNAAITNLHALLNQRLTATQMQAAEAAAREWLAGIGSEAP